MFHSRSFLVLAALAAAPLPAYSLTCEYCETQYTVCNANCFLMSDAACPSGCYNNWYDCTAGSGLVCTGSPGESSGASPELNEAQMDLVTQCSDALDAVNTQGVDFVSSAELEAQANLWAESTCPDTLAANGAMAISEYTDVDAFFQDISCVLCIGMIDPSSIQGDVDSCGCNGPSSAAPSISLNDLTELEAVMYCMNVAELVVTECAQPEPSCYQDCVDQENTCALNTCQDFVDQSDFYAQCYDACVSPKLACIAECDTIVSAPTNQNGSNGGGGSFLGGGGGSTNGNPNTSTNGSNGGGGSFLGGGGGSATSTTTSSASSSSGASFDASSFGATVLVSTLLTAFVLNFF